MSRTTLARRRTQESGFPAVDPQIPTLSQMIADGQVTADKIKRMTEGALLLWFNQSGRLCIARKHYNLRGARFSDFADRMGIERSNAFKLAKLWQHRHAILKRCREEGEMMRLGDDVVLARKATGTLEAPAPGGWAIR